MLKKLLPVTAALVMLFFVRGLTVTAAADGGFTYTIINGEATVIGFDGEPEELIIPRYIEGAPVTQIRDNAFFSCGTLRFVELPEGLRSMGHHCFYACTSLESISLPDSLTEIGMGCFCGCTALRNVRIGSGLDRLPDSCFRSCTALTETLIPQNVTEIEKFCFSGCTALKSVSLGGRLQSIGSYAFYMCNDLTELYVPASVNAIGTEAIGFVPDPNGAALPSAEGFTVYGESGSEAEKYARSCGIAFSETLDTVQAMAFGPVRIADTPLNRKLLTGGAVIFAVTVSLLICRKLTEKSVY